MQVILISGKAGHGKDQTASIMKERLELDGKRVLVTHYADLVKYVCKAYFGWNSVKDEAGRSLLQYVGTDVVRKQNPDYWVWSVVDMLQFFGDNWDYVLIPDTRFMNEVSIMKAKFHAIHIRVKRENYVSVLTPEQQRHPSETGLDNVIPDRWIYNSGTLDALKEGINQFITEELYGNEA